MSNKALVIGPNIGVSMGRGGGARVATKMAETLAENDFIVSFCALKGYSLDQLDSIHSTNLLKYRDRIGTYYFLTSGNGSRGEGRLSGVLPIHVGVLPFSLYLQYVIKRFSPHVLIFHDDIPILVRHELQTRLKVLYVHFSYATRLKLGVGDIANMTSPSKQCIEEFLNPLLKRLIFLQSNPADLIIANSSITASFVRQTWNRSDIAILHPPVDTNLYRTSRVKENLVVSIGAMQPNKRFEDIIKAISMVHSKCKLIITGYSHQRKYYHELQKLIEKMGLKNRIKIVLDASQRLVEDTLSRAKIIVHASQFEPFGIAVVEGMASGCVPIVYNGATSGPWVDIINKGEFGLGFKTSDELSENIEKILSDEKEYRHYSGRAKERSKEFDTLIFKNKFAKILGCTNS
jgi:glycosyltransferase involved in cell wall biosynthesis